jgi:hypothetical protein
MKNKRDFFEDCPVILDDTPYNRRKGINGKYGRVKYHDATLGVLVSIEECSDWVYYFANDIQAGIVG